MSRWEQDPILTAVCGLRERIEKLEAKLPDDKYEVQVTADGVLVHYSRQYDSHDECAEAARRIHIVVRNVRTGDKTYVTPR